MNNHIILKGNVTQPPYFDHVGDTGRPFLRLYLAVDRPRNPRTGAEQPPDFFRVVAYDDQALFTYPYLRSNSGLLIIGRLRARKRRLRGGGTNISRDTLDKEKLALCDKCDNLLLQIFAKEEHK